MTCYNSELPIGPPGPTGPIGPQGIPGTSANSSYKVYNAFLNQVDEDNPIAIELENTIGDIEWTRDEPGVYYGILLGAFVNEKTIIQLGITDANTANASIDVNTQISIFDVNTIRIVSDLDNQLTNYLLQIKIYL